APWYHRVSPVTGIGEYVSAAVPSYRCGSARTLLYENARAHHDASNLYQRLYDGVCAPDGKICHRPGFGFVDGAWRAGSHDCAECRGADRLLIGVKSAAFRRVQALRNALSE